MKAYKIDVVKQEVTLIDMEPNLQEIYSQLECSTIEMPTRLKCGDVLYVDEEALLKPFEQLKGAFYIDDFPAQALFGHGLIVGDDGNGNDVDALSTAEELSKKVIFLDADEQLKEYTRLTTQEPKIIWPDHLSDNL